MKKLFLIAAVAVLGVNSADAQVKFGVKAGPQLTNVVGDDAGDTDMKVGFNVGGFANIRFSEQFAFQPELLYSLQGYKVEESISEFGVTAKTEGKAHLSYINVPLMMKWYAYDGLNFEFGPQVGFNVAAKGKSTTTITGGEFDQTLEQDEDIDGISTVDFGVNIGAGYEMENGLNFGLRYGRGLTSVYDFEDANGDKAKAFNSVISLGIGYTF